MAADEIQPMRPPDVGWACRECRWWDAYYDGATKGLCRVRPPVIDADGDGAWPTTMADGWCGSFEEVPS